MNHSSGAAWELNFRQILCSSIGLASHVVHDFCRETPHTADFSLVSCDQKRISNMLDLKTQSLAIKIVSLKLPQTADFLQRTKIACHYDKNLLCALGFSPLFI